MLPKYALEVLTRSLARRIIYQGETIDSLLKKLSKLDKEVKDQLRESLEVYLEENKYEIEKIKMKLALANLKK
ncbi:hypothetical protein NH288_05350 [Anaerococcus sp. NML200537]|uniref:hypothetical protein n=1 Tax=Anaerococcus sp. NML200537 TaxID=2954485 RepID=UPI0022373EF7|nr:hypothetical protein [Anaerococcus sp. NML200537]MCW6701509.1 hypothetical protein [Anaerococcus sp. NML200537]